MHGTRARLVITALTALVATLAATAASPRNEHAAGALAIPTFNNDVAPILARRCVSCHRPGRPVPMALRSLAEARPWLTPIRSAVTAGRMPPWSADPRFGRFANDPTLTPAELDLLLRWIDGGAPAGPGTPVLLDAPEHAWTHPSGRPPDVVVELPTTIEVPASGQWPTFNLYSRLPAPLDSRDRFIEAAQLVPGNLRVTHHSSLSMRRFPAGVSLGRAQPWPGGPLLDGLPVLTDPAAFERASEPVPSGAAAFSSAGVSHLTYYFPGNDGFVMYPPTAGKRIRAAEHVEWSLHYTPGTAPERDRHRAGLWLHTGAPAHEVVTSRVGDFHIVNGEEIVLPAGLETNPGHAAIVDVSATCDGRPCTKPTSMVPPIPAGASNWRITGLTPVLDDVTVYSVSPHGHLRLRDMTYVVTSPDGREETILSVPQYDFDWQFVYRFAEPLRIQAGSTIKVTAHYDNSAGNRRNPDPSKPVQWSEQSTDEMFNGFIDLSIDRYAAGEAPGDTTPGSTRPLIIAAGCAARDADGQWSLIHATSPARSAIVHADALEVTNTRRTPDENRYRLLGTADFVANDELLRTGQRAAFTTAATTNATGQLFEGRSVGVKGVLVGGKEPAINLVSVWPVPGSCAPR